MPGTSFRVEYDPDLWLQVPTRFPAGTDTSAEDWVAREAAQRRAHGFRETTGTGTLDQYFADVRRVAHELGEHESVWALLSDDAPGFLAVVLDVADADGSLDDLLTALVAPTRNQFQPPTSVEIETPALGAGLRVVRFDMDAGKRLYETVFYVFRADGTDVVVSTQSYDVALLEWAMPSLDELVAGIRLDEAVEP